MCTFFLLLLASSIDAKEKAVTVQRQYYAIRIYHVSNSQQMNTVETYLQNSFLPAMHQLGYKTIGVFKPVGNDTATDKRIYVLIPFQSLEQFEQLPQQLAKNSAYANADNEYTHAAVTQPPYSRYETILLRAFEGHPVLELPHLTGSKPARIYELRSYESPSEQWHQNKMQMFIKGNEIGIFKRLNFNAVFYAGVLAGSHMPNLMYMTTFENMQDRDAHWKAFGADPAWKQLSSMPEYPKQNVSHIDDLFLTPVDYSDI